MALFPILGAQYYGILNPLNQRISMNNIIGRKFGKWIIVKDAGRDEKSNRLVFCNCECGNKKIITINSLKLKRTTQCKSCFLNILNKSQDLIGRKFGKWIVINKILSNKKRSRYLCICECGTKKEVDSYRLLNNKSKSCPHCRIKTHGMTYTDTYKCWRDIIRRCKNQNFKHYKYYGGRGIKVCERWQLFDNFLSDMGKRPAGLQIDRINNDGNYEPSNCRWVTSVVNMKNRRVSNP